MPEPKTVERRIAFRKANRKFNSRRHDIPVENLDFKNVEMLEKFTSQTGKILPRKTTGVTSKLHRRICREIKRARAVNLMP